MMLRLIVGISYLGVSELGEGIHDDTEDDVQTDGRDEHEERQVNQGHFDGVGIINCHRALHTLQRNWQKR